MAGASQWRIAFVMPSGRRMKTPTASASAISIEPAIAQLDISVSPASFSEETLAEYSSARMPRTSDWISTTEPRSTGSLRKGYFLAIETSLSFLMATLPFGWRTATE